MTIETTKSGFHGGAGWSASGGDQGRSHEHGSDGLRGSADDRRTQAPRERFGRTASGRDGDYGGAGYAGPGGYGGGYGGPFEQRSGPDERG